MLGDRTALHLAADYGHVEVVETLLSQGADIDAENDMNYTALHIAVEGDHKDIVRILLENGADSLPNRFGETPLEMAVEKGHTEMVEILRKAEGAGSE